MSPPPQLPKESTSASDVWRQLSSAVTLPEPPDKFGTRRPWVELIKLRKLVWSPYTLAIPALPPALAGLRILHLTDLHIDTTWMPAWDVLRQRVAEDPPELILITGDFVERKFDSRPAWPNLRRVLAGLSARLGVYGILGNHDGDLLATALADMNVRLLSNEIVTLHDGRTALELVGIHGVNRMDCSPRVRDAIPTKADGAVRIVLAHYPDQVATLASLRGDVFLAGHTHGGQVCLPGGRPLMTHDSLPKRFSRGVHRIGDTWLVVGRGLTFSTYPIRTFCPAEAIELTLANG